MYLILRRLLASTHHLCHTHGALAVTNVKLHDISDNKAGVPG